MGVIDYLLSGMIFQVYDQPLVNDSTFAPMVHSSSAFGHRNLLPRELQVLGCADTIEILHHHGRLALKNPNKSKSFGD